MDTIKINTEELSQMQQLGRGACSTVYRYNEGKAIKVLNDKGLELHNKDEFSKMVGIENDTCVFPKEIIEIDGKFYGYTMEYIQGQELQNVVKNIDMPTLLAAIAKVEGDLVELSANKVLFQDLNQGGLMWDEKEGCIKIIDTDFFVIKEDIQEKQAYSHNISSFNSMIEMELGILNGQGTKLSEYLLKNPEYSQLYSKYIIYSLNGKNMPVTELINKATEILELDFGVRPNNFEEMEEMVTSRIHDQESDVIEEIPTFGPPKENVENGDKKQLGIKQKIANFLANKKLLRKIPFIDRFVAKEQNMLPEPLTKEKENKSTRSKFIDEISNKGEYRSLSFRQQVKSAISDSIKVAKEDYRKQMAELEKLAPTRMSDQSKIEHIKKQMDGKSIDDD